MESEKRGILMFAEPHYCMEINGVLMVLKKNM